MFKFRLGLMVLCVLLAMNFFVSNGVSLDKEAVDSGFGEALRGDNISKISLSFPVNVMSCLKSTNSRINLRVEISGKFVSVPLPQANPDSVMLEFIPKTDTSVYNWSEIITVFFYRGQGISAEDVINMLKKSMSPIEVVESDTIRHENYVESYFIGTYLDNGRKEIVYVVYCSGPLDCVGFQYAMALNGSMTQKKAIKKIKKFVSENLKVVQF